MKGRIVDILLWSMLSAVSLTVLHYARRVFLFDRFVIPTSSMEPTLMAGDCIWVNKTLMGPRIYCNFNFTESAPFVCARLKGRRDVKPNDVIVFNCPYGWKKHEIAFKLNHLYAKRCIGCPGDSVGISRGWFTNNHYPGVIGNAGRQVAFAAMEHDADCNKYLRSGWLHRIDTTWTIRDFGPVYVPKSDECVELDRKTRALYAEVIAFETGVPIDTVMKSYTFKKNWYYACGDNVTNSNDSRHWGFIPEDFIVGIATRIGFSKDPATGRRRPDRFMKFIDR